MAMIAGWELFWRARGFQPSLTNNEALWCEQRGKVGSDAIVILGSSRLETGLDPALLTNELGHRVVQLAIDGGNGIPALLELGKDAAFHGTVVFEYMPRRVLTADSLSYAHTQEFVGACSNPSLIVGIEARMDREVEKRFAFLNFELEPTTILSHMARRKSLPRYSHAILRDDRFMALYFHGRHGSTEKEREPQMSAPDLERRLAAMHEAIASIRARGGRVILYRPPVSDGVLSDEETRFPTETWLPEIARKLDVPVIDFQSIPALRALEPPDGEHLEAADVPAATAALAGALRPQLGS